MAKRKRTRGLLDKIQPVHRRRDPVDIRITLHQDGGAMYAQLQNVQPVNLRIDVDPEARGFAEAVRVLVMQFMKADQVTVGI